jgi:LytS/YehU family sensor histidine kinase
VPIWALIIGLGATNIMVFWGIVAASQAVNYFRKYQEREFRLAQAQLQALRMQLHPHFLFNTLNAIAELVHSDPNAADRCIVSLSELLRFSLESQKTEEVTLKEELDFLEKYVEIQKTLMRDRLRVRLNVEPETLDASVPNMLLQPLVENAIKHGISPRAEGGKIEVYARRMDGKLYVEIADDGLGMHEQQDGNGVGLVNTQERLKHLYGHAHTFNLSSFPGRGVTIRISLPFREAVERDDTNADY